MSLVSAFLSLAAAVGMSAMTVVPRPGAERFRTMGITVTTSLFFAWLLVALWARTRHRMVTTLPVPDWLRRGLIVLNALYSLGIVFGVLA